MAILSKVVALSIAIGSAVAAPLAAPEPAANFNLVTGNSTLSRLARRGATNYNQDYIASGAGVTYTPNENAGTFTVSYNTNQDFVVGLGWQPGDSNPITYGGSFSASGVGLLSVYGWSTNPLVEYYIMEDGIGYQPEGTMKGSLTSDGATYNVWLHQQVNQPSIQGTSTFNQYISIRQSPRTSGTVTVENHFKAWAGYGMDLGTLNYQVIAVESWTGSGQGSISVAKGSSTGSTSPSSPSSSKTGSTPTSVASSAPTSGGSSAMYGQCGGIGWKGPTTCVSGAVCKESNSYYSQCLPA